MRNRDLAHNWAHSDIDGGNGKASNFFYQDGVLYSYGLHFIVATKLYHKGRTVYMLTNKVYSSTTTQHRSYAWQAIPMGEQTLHVKEPITQSELTKGAADYKHRQNVEDLRLEIANALHLHNKPRSRSGDYGKRAREAWDYLENYVDVFDLGREGMLKMLKKTEAEYSEWGERISTAYAEAIDRGTAVASRYVKTTAEATETALKNWLTGQRADMGRYASYLKHDYLRMSGEVVETTRGIRIGSNVARSVYDRLKTVMPDSDMVEADIKTAREKLVGQQVLDWKIQDVTSEAVIVIGCHKFDWKNVVATAAQFGW